MASNAITIPGVQIEEKPWVDTLHEWLTTVDHKRLGVLYILYALLFLVIAGIEALIIRIQLMFPHNHFVSPQVFNRLFTMHGTTMVFFMGMPILFGFANYLVPLMVGARDMAFPRLNAFSFWLSALGGLASLLQLGRRKWTVRRGQCTGCGMVGVCASDSPGIFARSQHRLLDPGSTGLRIWKHRDGNQYYCDHSVHALPGHEAQPHAFAGMAQPGHVRNGSAGSFAADRGTDHAAHRSIFRRPFLRCAGWAGQPCCGCTSSGYSDTRKCTS